MCVTAKRAESVHLFMCVCYLQKMSGTLESESFNFHFALGKVHPVSSFILRRHVFLGGSAGGMLNSIFHFSCKVFH